MYCILFKHKMNAKLDLVVVKRKFLIRAIGNIEALRIGITNAQVYIVINIVTCCKS